MSGDIEDPNDWFKCRPYPHFDSQIKAGRAEREVRRKVQSPKWIAEHAFYPLIKRVTSTPRYKLDRQGNRRRKHKKRPICYASHIDAHIFAYYSAILSKLYEDRMRSEGLTDCVTAYRSLGGRSNIHHASEVFAYVDDNAPRVVIAFDVEGFFNNLDHRLLREAWRSLLPESGTAGLETWELPINHYKVLRAATKYAYVNEHRLKSVFPSFYAQSRSARRGRQICSSEGLERLREKDLIAKNTSGKGIPQGLPISAQLSNVYMLPFDKRVFEFCSGIGGMYRRYSDDLIVICPIGAEKEVEEFVLSQIADRKLVIQTEKTARVQFFPTGDGTLNCLQFDEQWQLLDEQDQRPLQYLGFTFDGREVLVRPSSIGRYRMNMDGAVWAAAADAKKAGGKEVYRRKLYRRYTQIGRREIGKETRYGRFRGNFITYAKRAISIFERSGLNANGIRRQIRRHMNRLDVRVKRAESKL